ncbi:MAG: hypothetical protein ACFFCS_14890 [Candidatus Hodarchaeota archaeon]
MAETERRKLIDNIKENGGIALRNQELKEHANGIKFLINKNYVLDGLLEASKKYMLLIIPELEDTFLEEKKGKELKFEHTESEFIKCLNGIAVYLGKKLSFPLLYGGSGFGFMTNVHEGLFPRGEFGWNIERIFPLIENLGLQVNLVGMVDGDTSQDEKEKIESLIKSGIDSNIPHIIISDNHCQVIVGYSDFCFYLKPATVWTVPQFTTGTWEEYSEEKRVSVYKIVDTNATDEKTIYLEALEAAVNMRENISSWINPPFHGGIEAYDVYVESLKKAHEANPTGKGIEGLRVNSFFNVHFENRAMVSKFFAEMQELPLLSDEAKELTASLEKNFRREGKHLRSVQTRTYEKIEQVKEQYLASLENMKKLIEIMKKTKN